MFAWIFEVSRTEKIQIPLIGLRYVDCKLLRGGVHQSVKGVNLDAKTFTPVDVI